MRERLLSEVSPRAGHNHGLARRNRLNLVLLALLLILPVLFLSRPAESATAYRPISIINWGNDRWYNYDFNSTVTATNNVDWAVGVLFINNATIDKTKSRMDAWTYHFDNPSQEGKHARLSNYYNDDWGWDRDGGKKNPVCPVYSDSNHYRVYATTNGGYERLYNTTLGYYVIGTTHRDWDECGGNKRHGKSEAVENLLISAVDENTTTVSDRYKLHNQEPYRVQGNHSWSGNGYASTVRIP